MRTMLSLDEALNSYAQFSTFASSLAVICLVFCR